MPNTRWRETKIRQANRLAHTRQLLQRYAKDVSQLDQDEHRHAPVAQLIREHSLLRHFERTGQLGLGHALFLAQLRDVLAKCSEVRTRLRFDARGVHGIASSRSRPA